MRYMRKGNVWMRFVPTIANKAAPTVAELGAGTDITPDIAELSGFEYSNSPIDTPDFANTFTPKIGGEDTSADSSITFYEHSTAVANAIKTALPKGTAGYVVLSPYTALAPAAAQKVEVWPVTIIQNSRRWSAGNDAANFVVQFAPSATPNDNATVAA